MPLKLAAYSIKVSFETLRTDKIQDGLFRIVQCFINCAKYGIKTIEFVLSNFKNLIKSVSIHV